MNQDATTDFRALAEQMWHGAEDLVHDHHPVRSNYPGAQEFSRGLLYLKGTAVICVVDTGAGLERGDQYPPVPHAPAIDRVARRFPVPRR